MGVGSFKNDADQILRILNCIDPVTQIAIDTRVMLLEQSGQILVRRRAGTVPLFIGFYFDCLQGRHSYPSSGQGCFTYYYTDSGHLLHFY